MVIPMLWSIRKGTGNETANIIKLLYIILLIYGAAPLRMFCAEDGNQDDQEMGEVYDTHTSFPLAYSW